MDYKQLVLDTIYSSNYKPMNIGCFKEKFNIETSEEFTNLVKAIAELESIYEIALDNKDNYRLAKDLGIFTGILKVNPKGFGFVDSSEFSCYVSKDNFNYGMDGDEVVAQIINEEEQEAKVIKITKRSNEYVIGTIKIKDNEIYFLSDKQLFNYKFKITNLKKFKLVNDLKVLLKIKEYTNPLVCEIDKVIGHKHDPGVDILSILLEHDVRCEFPQEVLDNANEVSKDIVKEDYPNREDFTNDIIITIDGDDAKDLDDAISVKKLKTSYELQVHIADVSHYVTPNSHLDEEAYLRGTSVYVTDRVVPMLPHVLSNGICSLNENVNRLTMSCVMEINLLGEVVNYRIVEGIINTRNRMTYNNVNKIIDNDQEVIKEYSHLLELINNMQELSKIVRKRRYKLGAINFDTKESKILVKPNGKPYDIVLRERGESEKIIEDFMIAANECVAAHMRWQELPCMYRIHDEPDQKKIRDFIKLSQILGHPFKVNVNNMKPSMFQQYLTNAKTSDEYDVLSVYLLRCMAKAKYDPKCIGHFGLGLENYLHFTSPIRRYPDLVVHRMIKKYCINTNVNYNNINQDELWIAKAAIQSSEKEYQATLSERDVNDLKKAEYMEKHIGSIFDGKVSGITNFGMFIELDNTVEGLVHVSTMDDDHYIYDSESRSLRGTHTGKTFKMGQAVVVRCIDSSRYKKQVDFEIFKKKDRNKSRRWI